MIFKIMPFFLPVISFSFDAALVVYFVISNLYRIIQQGYITRKFYGENAAKESVVVSETVEKSTKNVSKNSAKKPINTEKKNVKASIDKVSSSEAKRKRTTAGSNENNSHLNEEKTVKSRKKEKNKEVKNTGPIDKKPANSGRITPSGTNVPRSQKKRKKKKRK